MPGAGLAGICGVVSGKAAPLVGGPPGVELHTVFDGLPSGDVGDMVPVVLPANVEMVPSGTAASRIDGDHRGCAAGRDVETALSTVDGVGPGRCGNRSAAAELVLRAAAAPGTVEPGKTVINDESGVGTKSAERP